MFTRTPVHGAQNRLGLGLEGQTRVYRVRSDIIALKPFTFQNGGVLGLLVNYLGESEGERVQDISG